MRCEEVFHQIYNRDPDGVAFCPYRVSPLGATARTVSGFERIWMRAGDAPVICYECECLHNMDAIEDEIGIQVCSRKCGL